MINPHEQSIFALISNPGRLVFGVWEFGISWLFSRRWSAIAFVLIPLAALLFVVLGAAYGNYRDREQMLLGYWERIEKELGSEALEIGESRPKSSNDGSATNEDQEKNSTEDVKAESATEAKDTKDLSEFSDLLLQRVLALDTSNLRANYWVARHLGTQGRLGQSRWMMRKIASDKTRGFAPAHAWLAQDHIVQYKQGVVELNENQLRHDLEIATRWSGAHPLLMTTYAELLLKSGKVGDALRVYELAVQREPLLSLQFASFAKSIKNADGTPNAIAMKTFDEVAQRMHNEAKDKIAAKTATGDEVAAIAQLALLGDDWQKAITIAERAFSFGQPTAFVRRTLSDAHLLKYVSTADLSARKFDLVALDAALKADGSNQRVTEEVARLISMGESASPELTAILEEKLASGQANAVTHLFIGNQKMVSDRLQEAVGHFEVAMRLAPTSPVILNNFALATTRFKPNDPEVLKRAEICMQNALRFSDPKLRAELLDSLGEIRMTAGDLAGAIASFEDSIKLGGQVRTSTRRKLIKAYRANGMESMAVAQEREIAQGN